MGTQVVLDHLVQVGTDNWSWTQFSQSDPDTNRLIPVDLHTSGITRILVEGMFGGGPQVLLDTTELDGALMSRERRSAAGEYEGWLGIRFGLLPAAPRPAIDTFIRMQAFQGPGDLNGTRLLHQNDPEFKLVVKWRA